ncbi:MAG: elongation factor P [Candidatus Peregrinibacteria bacterium]
MYGITELKPGRAIQIDGIPYLIISSIFGRKSQSKANMQCKIKNMRTGAVIPRNFQGADMIEPADVGYRKCQFLFTDGEQFTFMDLNSYDQFFLNKETLGPVADFLVEGGEVDALLFEDNPIGIKLPSTVDLKVKETIPGVKGDTASGGGKPATMESGVVVSVPLFIEEGDIVRVNTETGEYMRKVDQK